MKTDLFLIEALTNLHVGSGDINFDIVDNQVQRDPITNLPIIHSSSLKGAFREHFENDSNGKNFINYIFGSEPNKEENEIAGAYSFFDAHLLTRPVRSDKRAFYNATSPMCIKRVLDMIEDLHIKVDFKDELEEFYNEIENIKEIWVFDNFDEVILEDEVVEVEKDTKEFEKIDFLKNLAVYPDDKFKELELPVIARNKIGDEGTSENLWYEEIVPKKTQFFFFIAKPDNISEGDMKKAKNFDERFLNGGEIIQIGANKSIGYGFCKIRKLGGEEDEQKKS